MFYLKSKKQKGFTLLELLLVLGVIAALTIGAFYIYPKVKAASTANTEKSNLSTIAAGIKLLYPTGYQNLDNSSAILSRVYPDTMVDENKNTHSSFGGDVIVKPDSVGTPSGKINTVTQFDMVYSEMPSNICIKMGTGLAFNFANVTVQGDTIFKLDDNNAYKVDVGLVTKQCNLADKVTMIFVIE